ncbi:MAG: serine hydrolase [Lachnospiraceae bacterium]|nr:serine hydrolase [Lachnospiraceae bacterium]
MKVRKISKNLIAVLLSFVLVIFLLDTVTVRTNAITHRELEDLTIEIPDGSRYTVKTIHYSYSNNRYVSLRDMAFALKGTAKHFGLSVGSTEINIKTGSGYESAGGENTGFAEGEYTTEGIKINPITIDDRKCRYYTFLGNNTEGVRDAFISITDLAMILDSDLKIDPESGIIKMSDGDFYIDMQEYEAQGLYYEVYSAIVGDATTGTVYSAYNENASVSAASTTKLMTYLCIMDAVSDGEVSLDDNVTISGNAAAISQTSDGVIKMNEGQSALLSDMMYAILLPSSNEAALAVAEHIDGSEEEFVKRMNLKARELNLSEATFFYNCHGLPEYSDTVAASKIQNRISAYDMFVLSGHILNKYPEIKEITTTQKYKLDAFGVEVENTNPLLYNLPGVVGLKTGTTNAAGASLVSAYDFDDGSSVHTIVAVEYGAEDATVRNTVSEILIRYGIQCMEDVPQKGKEEEAGFPLSYEDLLKRIVLNKSRRR